MRQLVIEEIIKNFERGLDEIDRAFYKGYPNVHPIYKLYSDWNERYNSKCSGLYKMKEKYCWTTNWYLKQKKSMLNDFVPELRGLLNMLEDEDLLRALDGQHCQDYR